MTESRITRKYGLIPDQPDARDKVFNSEPLGQAAEKGNLSRMPEGEHNASVSDKNKA